MATGNRGAAIQLPVDIWQHIAGCLTTKEWVQVTSTSKMIQSVLPARIELTSPTPKGLDWVQRHWGRAKGINLEFNDMDRPWEIQHDAASLSHLLELRVVVNGSFSCVGAVFLTWLLSRTDALCLPVLSVSGPISVPPLRHLCHLRLYGGSFGESALLSLSHLVNLRTLELTGVDSDTDSAQLALASLSDLTCVLIEDVSLAGIDLPSQCCLHVRCEAADGMREWWSDIACRHRLGTFFMNDGLSERDEVPDFLRSAKCDSLRLLFTCLGSPSQPASLSQPSFGCLRELLLCGGHLHISVPSFVALQVLHVTADDLTILFESPQVLAGSLQDLSIIYGTLRGNDMIKLAIALSQVKKDFKYLEGDDRLSGIFMTKFYRSEEPWPCACGACHDCLIQKDGVGQYLHKPCA